MAGRAPKSAFQVILEKIDQFMKDVEGKKVDKDKVTPEVRTHLKERLHELQQVVAEFTDLSNKMLSSLSVTPEEASKAASKPIPFLNEADTETMRYSNEVLQRARRKQAELHMVMRAIRARGEANTTTGGKRVLGKARRKKFRRIGGKDNWMPM